MTILNIKRVSVSRSAPVSDFTLAHPLSAPSFFDFLIKHVALCNITQREIMIDLTTVNVMLNINLHF